MLEQTLEPQMKCEFSNLCGSKIDGGDRCRCGNSHLFRRLSLMQHAPEQRHRRHDHMKNGEDSTAGFKQVFLVYTDQKLVKSGEKHHHLLRFTDGDLLDFIVLKKKSKYLCSLTW